MRLTFCRSASVIGLYVSYVTPIFLRITSGRDKLVPGPFSLGKWFVPIGIIAVCWVSFIIVLLVFPPEVNPTAATMSKLSSLDLCVLFAQCSHPCADYTVVIIMAVFVFASVSWAVSARHWFKGPVKTIEGEDGTPSDYDEKKERAQVEEESVGSH